VQLWYFLLKGFYAISGTATLICISEKFLKGRWTLFYKKQQQQINNKYR